MIKKMMAGALVLALLLGFVAGARAQEVKVAATAPQWVELYNGKNLDGWVQAGDMTNRWKADGDTIVGESVPGSKAHGFLCTQKEYGDFILEADFKVDPKLPSGIQIRSMSYPEYFGGLVHGNQVVIEPASGRTGGIMEEAGRHWLTDMKGDPRARTAFRQNQWNHLSIACVGDTIKTWLNGIPAANLRDSKTPIGFIALEIRHDSTSQTLQSRFRNIRILALDQDIPARRTYVEIPELSPENQKTWVAPVLAQPENKPNKGSATTYKNAPKMPQPNYRTRK